MNTDHLKGWERLCDTDARSLAERITIILGAMGAACAVALLVALALR